MAYGGKDAMVGATETPRYIKVAREHGANVTDAFVPDGNHGFGPDEYFDQYLTWLGG